MMTGRQTSAAIRSNERALGGSRNSIVRAVEIHGLISPWLDDIILSSISKREDHRFSAAFLLLVQCAAHEFDLCRSRFPSDCHGKPGRALHGNQEKYPSAIWRGSYPIKSIRPAVRVKLQKWNGVCKKKFDRGWGTLFFVAYRSHGFARNTRNSWLSFRTYDTRAEEIAWRTKRTWHPEGNCISVLRLSFLIL